MTTLSDLTTKQLTTAFGALAQIEVRAKTFNSRGKAQSRLEALLAEKGLTVADALRAAGIEDKTETETETEAETEVEAAAAEPAPVSEAPIAEADTSGEEIPDDGTGCEIEQQEDGDIPGTEDSPEPGMIWNGDEQKWEHLPEEPAEADTVSEPTSEPEPESIPEQQAPVQNRVSATGLAGLALDALKPFASLDIEHFHTRADNWIVFCINDSAITTGDIRRARAAFETLAGLTAGKQQPAAPRPPRTGTKQETVLA
ncbi:MAG: hypothetical protein WCF85_21795, partial [Rhodospirillaceae bacterium]